MFGSSGEHLSFKHASKHGFSSVQIGLFQNEISKIGLRQLVKDLWDQAVNIFVQAFLFKLDYPFLKIGFISKLLF